MVQKLPLGVSEVPFLQPALFSVPVVELGFENPPFGAPEEPDFQKLLFGVLDEDDFQKLPLVALDDWGFHALPRAPLGEPVFQRLLFLAVEAPAFHPQPFRAGPASARPGTKDTKNTSSIIIIV